MNYSCMKWVGTKGPMNSEIISVFESNLYGEYGIILAKRMINLKTPIIEFITWEFNANSENEINCYWGHYFNDENKARLDFIKRVSDLMAVKIN